MNGETLEQILSKISWIDLTQSVIIGDFEVDMQAGKNAGCTCILIKSACSDNTSVAPMVGMDYVVKDLLEAARLFTQRNKIKEPGR